MKAMADLVLDARERAVQDPSRLAVLRGLEKKALVFFRGKYKASLVREGMSAEQADDAARKLGDWETIYRGMQDDGMPAVPVLSFEDVEDSELDKAWASVDEEDRRAERGIKL